MARASWNGAVLAESDRGSVVEGNYYFPPDSIKPGVLAASDTRTTCPWKGIASYFDIQVAGAVLKDAAWSYADPKDAAAAIKDHVAFWKDVAVEQ